MVLILLSFFLLILALIVYAFFCESVYDPISIPETDLERKVRKIKEELKLCSMRFSSK